MPLSNKGEKSMKPDTSTQLTVTPRPLPWDSFLRNVDEIENKIARRAYELFASRGFTDGHDLDDWFLAESELFGRMPVNVTETDKEVTVKAGLPGFTEKDIEIRVEPHRLFIDGKHEEKSEEKRKGETVYSERSNQVFRAIDLPADVDPDKVKATLSKGELEIILPKKEIGKQVTIEEKAA
jgi:HSP20 family protein